MYNYMDYVYVLFVPVFRPQYRHAVIAPSLFDAYGGSAFPGIGFWSFFRVIYIMLSFWSLFSKYHLFLRNV